MRTRLSLNEAVIAISLCLRLAFKIVKSSPSGKPASLRKINHDIRLWLPWQTDLADEVILKWLPKLTVEQRDILFLNTTGVRKKIIALKYGVSRNEIHLRYREALTTILYNETDRDSLHKLFKKIGKIKCLD